MGALANLVSVERTEGPVAIKREQGVRNAVAIANVGGRDLVGFVAQAQSRIGQEVSLPSGYYLAWGGEFENQQRAAQRLAIVVPLAVGLVFLLLFSTFGSVRQAVLVLTNIPFAMIGGIAALWATGEYLSVPASVGFIALLGIAVLNGVVMVSYFNQLRAAGRSLEATVIEGAQRRLRPVLMTASIAALGLVPLLFATGPGSEIQRPLAIVVIGVDVFHAAHPAAAARPLSPLRRGGPMNERAMTPADGVLVLVTLVVSPTVADALIDWLLQQPLIRGFSSHDGMDHGQDPQQFSVTEQVAGVGRGPSSAPFCRRPRSRRFCRICGPILRGRKCTTGLHPCWLMGAWTMPIRRAGRVPEAGAARRRGACRLMSRSSGTPSTTPCGRPR